MPERQLSGSELVSTGYANLESIPNRPCKEDHPKLSGCPPRSPHRNYSQSSQDVTGIHSAEPGITTQVFKTTIHTRWSSDHSKVSKGYGTVKELASRRASGFSLNLLQKGRNIHAQFLPHTPQNCIKAEAEWVATR